MRKQRHMETRRYTIIMKHWNMSKSGNLWENTRTQSLQRKMDPIPLFAMHYGLLTQTYLFFFWISLKMQRSGLVLNSLNCSKKGRRSYGIFNKSKHAEKKCLKCTNFCWGNNLISLSLIEILHRFHQHTRVSVGQMSQRFKPGIVQLLGSELNKKKKMTCSVYVALSQILLCHKL